jgi:hypothetical protein
MIEASVLSTRMARRRSSGGSAAQELVRPVAAGIAPARPDLDAWRHR